MIDKPVALRESTGAHGVSRWTTAPCHGTCGGDTLHVGGECVHCGASAPKVKVQHGRGLLHVRRVK